jgi:hypothetical protein
MKIRGACEVREIFFRECISIGGVTLLLIISKGERENDKKRNICSMKMRGETTRGDTLSH